MSDPDAATPPQARHAAPALGLGASAEALTLHTDLLGDVQVPGGAGRSVELEALAARATIYATRAARAPAASTVPPGANRSAASRWPAIPT